MLRCMDDLKEYVIRATDLLHISVNRPTSRQSHNYFQAN